MAVRLLVLALLCASCGRVAFDPGGDARDDSATSDVPIITPLVQTVDITMDAPQQQATILPVDTTRTIVLCDFRTGTSSVASQPACELTDANTVTVTVGLANASVIVHVQIVQLPVGATVQRGTYDVSSGSTTAQVPINAVDLTRSFVVTSRWASLDTAGLDERFRHMARLASASTLQFDRVASGNTLHIAWQVVTWPAASVTQATRTIPNGNSGTLVVSAVANVSQTFAMVTAAATNAIEQDYMVFIRIETSGNLSYSRFGSTNAIDLTYFLVDSAQVRVQHGFSLLAAQAAISVPITLADPSRAMVLLSMYGGAAGNPDSFHQVTCTGTLQQDLLVLARNPTVPADVNVGVSWDVVELL